MVKTYLMSLLLIVATSLGISAQVVTTEPSPLQEDSQDVKIFFHADLGTGGLKNQPATAAIYAHTGACLSNGDKWVNAPDWKTNLDKYKMIYVSHNMWRLDIVNLLEFYEITD
ncbi:MAG: hypothetical protein K2G69_04035, partial [Muribaculaceae bacterium]|nr:hypothetical protein [Muribaculaceae bacterium]